MIYRKRGRGGSGRRSAAAPGREVQAAFIRGFQMHVHSMMGRFGAIELIGVMIVVMTIALIAVAVRYMLTTK